MINDLKATKRVSKTTGELNTLRAKGFVPAVLYGGKNPNLKISIEEKFLKNIQKSKIKKLIITDTIDNSKKIKKTNKIQVLSIAQLMAEAIKRISNSTSVSSLFN